MKLKPAIKVVFFNCDVTDNLALSIVKAQHALNKAKQVIEASKGDRTQLVVILKTLGQPISLGEEQISPAPTRALIMVCVPLIGMPKTDEAMMKLNAAIVTANITKD